MRHLFAWEENTLIGRFDQPGSGAIRFEYATQSLGPISLSLPLSGVWDEATPKNFLDGLLPDGDTERLRMQKALGAKSTDSFDLLDSVDSSGGLVFTTTGEPPLQADSLGISPAISDDIEAQMERVWCSGDAWWKPDRYNRFSLAGSQGKFSVAIHNGMWFWPSSVLPSTHIVKPDGRRVADVAEVEHATMELARACGIEVPYNEVIRFGQRVGYLVERFDRRTEQGMTRRLRTEDLAQSLGISPDDKYEPGIADIVRCLRKGGADELVLYEFVCQVAFNIAVGNSDAHAKNYSIFLSADGIRLSPLYDAICMAHWEQFKYGTLAMPVNDIFDPWEIALHDWRAEALRCDLDPDEVERIVREVTARLLAQDPQSLPCDERIAHEVSSYVRECTRDLLPSL